MGSNPKPPSKIQPNSPRSKIQVELLKFNTFLLKSELETKSHKYD